MFRTRVRLRIALSAIVIATSAACDSGKAVTPVSCSETPLASGATVSASLSDADCTVNGRYMRLYSVTVSAGQALLVDMVSTDLDAYLHFMTTERELLGENDDLPPDGSTAPGTDSRLVVLAPAGPYLIGATTYDQGESGAFAIDIGTHSGQSADCTEIWIVPGITTTQQLTTTDTCSPSAYFHDWFAVRLRQGQSVTVTMRSTELDAYLIVESAGAIFVENNDFEPGVSQDARVTITAPVAGTYWILPSTNAEGETGQYTLTVQ